ncbi:MAG: hypothetical protein ACRD0P_02730 [Stackebrandtia sp.]
MPVAYRGIDLIAIVLFSRACRLASGLLRVLGLRGTLCDWTRCYWVTAIVAPRAGATVAGVHRHFGGQTDRCRLAQSGMGSASMSLMW